MIDVSEEVADALRTVWMWFMVSPLFAPLGEILEEAGFAVGLSIPVWSPAVLSVVAAGVLVGLGERRYRAVIVTGFLTAFGWLGLRYVLVGGSAGRVYGSPRLVFAEFLLWITAVCLAVVLVFYVDYGTGADDPSEAPEDAVAASGDGGD